MRELRKTPTSVSVGGWRGALSPDQAADVEMIAGEELRRVGYALSGVRRPASADRPASG
jgi:hypothetical protein